MQRVAILGSGSWGTALGVHLAQVGNDVRLWGRDRSLVADMMRRRANAVYLPDITFPPSLAPVEALADALEGANVVVIAVPSHGLRAVVQAAADYIGDGALVVSAAKGIEVGSLARMSEVIAAEAPRVTSLAVLSGPSFASELARGLPTAVVVASASPGAVEHLQQSFRSPALRLYASNDMVGVEIGGALKNIIAIAAGVVEGLGLGHNALAAVVTRGLAEITRLAVAQGGQRETLAGLAGLGDLVLTCHGQLSRNRHVGAELARGRSLPEILASTKMVAEGVRTTDAALALAATRHIEMPIAEQVQAMLAGRKDVPTAIRDLMGRRQGAE